ncbi:Hypothetical protein FKW44_004856 [Caligus rogercresseyi]|uniref:Uncharacterized protein n=1 Tax=Caligus rogercresseyi TaxID=217165 RepID=A0A7T8KAS7_CALRO|nr:Hypothetical protein FKW44_004856 [Caligus rogercresseyi]
MSTNKFRQIIITGIEAKDTWSNVARSMIIATSTVYKAWADFGPPTKTPGRAGR